MCHVVSRFYWFKDHSLIPYCMKTSSAVGMGRRGDIYFSFH